MEAPSNAGMLSAREVMGTWTDKDMQKRAKQQTSNNVHPLLQKDLQGLSILAGSFMDIEQETHFFLTRNSWLNNSFFKHQFDGLV